VEWRRDKFWEDLCPEGACRLDIFLCVSQAPDGRTENSPGLQPWDDTHKEIALKGRPNVIDYNV
jgi:hypothetical protein